MKIGFIGLGAMGRPMCLNVIKAGHDVKVFDFAEDACKAVVEAGATLGKNNADVARDAEIIFTSLPNSAIVESVLIGPEGCLTTAPEGCVFVDLSSITPASIRKIHKAAKEKGVGVVDSPVSGGVEGAKKGTLTLMVGGDKEDIEKVKPVLEAIGSKINLVGEVGAGDTMKLVNNLLLGANMVATAEAFALGVACGLDPDTMYDVISNSSGSSYALTAKYPNYISKRNFKPGFAVDLQHKDLQLAVDTAKDLKTPLFVGNVAQQFFEIARAEGYGKEDISSVIKIFEKWNGKEV